MLSLALSCNFMRAGSFPYNNCVFSPINDNLYYEETNSGFTPEQFANIRYSVEHDYTGCNITDACNYDVTSTNLLRLGESSCKFPCAKDGGCLITDEEYQPDYSEYECSGNLSSLNEKVFPEHFFLEYIYPNPFNPTTTIKYGLSQYIDVQISIYDITGKLIATLINEFQIAGHHSIAWDASNYSSGIYFLNMSSGEISETKKLVLIK